MFAGLIIGTLPLAAPLRIGSSTSVQPELNVPITPITLLFDAYAFAFAEHFSDAHLPAWAVASSQDW